MRNFPSFVMVGALCALLAVGCKKKEPAPAAQGTGSAAAMQTGSSAPAAGAGGSAAAAGSATATGSAMATGSATAAGSDTGSAAGSSTGSAATGSAGSAANAGSAAAPEGRNWDCKKTCKLAVSCKSKAGFHNVKECEQDCTSVAKDTTGRYERGSIEGAPYYTCANSATDCAGIKKCDH